MATDHRPPKDAGAQGRQAEREAKLAQALRANLRRRKVESSRDGPARDPSAPKSGESA